MLAGFYEQTNKRSEQPGSARLHYASEADEDKCQADPTGRSLRSNPGDLWYARVYIRADKDVKAGEEFLTTYGNDYDAWPTTNDSDSDSDSKS